MVTPLRQVSRNQPPSGWGDRPSPWAQWGSSLIALPPSMSSRTFTLETMSNDAPPIVLIHGLWLATNSWQGWVERYRAAGHVVHAPDWPADPGVGLAGATDYFEAFVRSLPDAPIIVGHAMGGLITQRLLDRGLGRSGVAIAPSKPRGVLRPPLSMWRSAWPWFRAPRNRRRAVPISPAHFH